METKHVDTKAVYDVDEATAKSATLCDDNGAVADATSTAVPNKHSKDSTTTVTNDTTNNCTNAANPSEGVATTTTTTTTATTTATATTTTTASHGWWRGR